LFNLVVTVYLSWFNAGLNVLCGVGILSTPYAAKEGGWLGLSILLIFAVLSFYTGMLLRDCLDSEPGLGTYPDIGQAAFGTAGRVVISVSLVLSFHSRQKLQLKCWIDMQNFSF
jgi:vesicular inhibitory amino acid transporter